MFAGQKKRTVFFKGLAALLPTAVTIIILVKLYELVSGTIGRGLRWIVIRVIAVIIRQDADVVGGYVPSIVGVALAIALIYFAGLVLALLVGRKLWTFVEGRLRRFPLIDAIYPPVKQLTDFFLEDERMAFGRVVLIEYPRKGIYSLGFVTNRGFTSTESMAGREMVTVFVPSSPTPFTGYCIQIAKDEVKELPIPVDSAVKYVVSGGVILPPEEGGTASELIIPGLVGGVREGGMPGNEDPDRKE